MHGKDIMLDQADFIARFDKHNALEVVSGQPDQLRHVFEDLKLNRPDNIVLAGMGGSALGGELIKNWLEDRLEVPFQIVRGYTLPAYVGKNSLVVVSSYSGNTEETLACLSEAVSRGACIVELSDGGKLKERALAEKHFFVELPGGLQPRMAVLYQVRAWAQILEAAGLLTGLVAELEAAADWVKQELTVWQAVSPTAHNPAKQIAEALVGHPVVIYGGPTLALPTMKWKIDFNENAKHLAFYNYLPEFNHNEFNGWAHPEQPGLKVVELRSDLDHPQIIKRFDVTNRLLSNRFSPIEVHANGKNKLQQILWTLILGDFVSVYLAILNGVDPTPVDLVEKLKQELA